MFMHTEVRWLSRGRLRKCVDELRHSGFQTFFKKVKFDHVKTAVRTDFFYSLMNVIIVQLFRISLKQKVIQMGFHAHIRSQHILLQ